MNVVIVRCRAPNGIELRLFEMKPEIPGSQVMVAHVKDTFKLANGDMNLVPAAFWDVWREQHPDGLGGVMEIGREQESP